MSVLYIMGNGFDLYNGLKTRYSDFHRYVTKHFPELEYKIENYFNFATDSEYLWKNFEQDLSTFNYEALFDEHNHIDVLSDSFRPSEGFGLEDEIKAEVDNLIDEIKQAFTEWIEEIEFPENKLSASKFPDGAKFINFNYTDTLELLYNVRKEDILYIHNNANSGWGELIFGHGLSEEPNPAQDELDEEGNSNRTIFTDAQAAARYPFYALMKDTEEILKEHQIFFEGLKGIGQVIILGHSLGKVDWPYFKRISKSLPQADWKFSYFSKSGMESTRFSAMEMLEIDTDRIKLITIDEH